MGINVLFCCILYSIIYNMEEVYKINQNMSSTPSSSPSSPENKQPTVYTIVTIVIVFFVIVFYVMYSNVSEDVKEGRIIYTHEEKLEILEGLAGNPENIPSIEERKDILNDIAENKPADARKYSQEEKLNILYSLQ